jgi:hypothetical protein
VNYADSLLTSEIGKSSSIVLLSAKQRPSILPIAGPLYGNTALRKYLVIPDDIVEDLSHFRSDAGVWEEIRAAILLEKGEQPHPNGKSGGE